MWQCLQEYGKKVKLIYVKKYVSNAIRVNLNHMAQSFIYAVGLRTFKKLNILKQNNTD